MSYYDSDSDSDSGSDMSDLDEELLGSGATATYRKKYKKYVDEISGEAKKLSREELFTRILLISTKLNKLSLRNVLVRAYVALKRQAPKKRKQPPKKRKPSTKKRSGGAMQFID